MSLTIHTAILCDQIRREDNGKLLLIGVYPQDMVVQNYPFSVNLALFVQASFTSAGKIPLNIKLEVDGGSDLLIDGEIDVLAPQEHSWLPIPVPTLNVDHDTTVSASYKDGNSTWVPFYRIGIRKGEFPRFG